MFVARPTGNKFYNRHYSTIVEYEYRGRTYEVEYANDMSYGVTPPRIQHQNAQALIDEEIEEENKPKKETRYEDTADYGFKLFWDYVEGEDDYVEEN